MTRTKHVAAFVLAGLSLCGFAALAPAQEQKKEPAVPHGQSKPPGPALSPREAMAKMTLPPGFKVTLAAAEPDVVNPTAFTFDDRGRIWLCESVEYPRRSPGKGKDRVKILEDADRDGTFEKVTIFKDGLNIPCGVVHGNGGVYVTNAPDILFLRDTDGDDVADQEEVILTGFGRDDTHELPNSLTWGPDGWLYGMNGVFNRAKVKDPASGKVYDFTCAIWRYHPKSKKFELFAEGTSNPWGLDYNRQGDWFISACVIDHLWHMTQSGYYHRQGGPYPPLTVKLESITTEKHQAAAYAGLCIYDADQFPDEYRGRLMMGNLHGSAINQDVLTDNGATYVQRNVKDEKGDGGPRNYQGNLDFLQADDAWFMPVSQKIGPDGCLYVMDWYDRYHCYQDANRDSPGLDRLKGRIYRISYGDPPAVKPFDLAKLPQEELLKLLGHPNVWWRRMAQRHLNERYSDNLTPVLKEMALNTGLPNNQHVHALWLLVSQNALDPEYHATVLGHADPVVRNWGVRGIGNADSIAQPVYEKLIGMANDPSPDVRVQVPIAAGRLTGQDPLPVLFAMLKNDDNARQPLIPNILYNNLKPLVSTRGKEILAFFEANPKVDEVWRESVGRWIRTAINTGGRGGDEIVADLKKALAGNARGEQLAQSLQTTVDGLGLMSVGDRARFFDNDTRAAIARLAGEDSPARLGAIQIALWWRDPKAIEATRQFIANAQAPAADRVALLRALADARIDGNTDAFAALLSDDNAPIRLRQVAADALGGMGRPEAARVLIQHYARMPADLKPMAVNALTRTAASAGVLLDAVKAKTIPVSDLNANHARQIAALNNPDLAQRLTAVWGKVKTERDPERAKLVEKYREIVNAGKGDPLAGWAVFDAQCGQCHTIYGRGGQVGPDITGVGRDDLTAVLTNLLDPNLVIGNPYFVHVARRKNGTVFSGLLVEQSDERIVLKDQTRTESIPKSELDRLVVQEISMMPEGLEQAMTEQQFRDLVAFLLTREPPVQRPGTDPAGGK